MSSNLRSLDREALVERLRALAEQAGAVTVSRSMWLRETGISERQYHNHFDSWNEFVLAAGLKPDESHKRLSDDELFEAMRDACIKAQGIVPRKTFRRYCRHSDTAYAQRWGGWQNVLARFREWVEAHDPDFPYRGELPADSIEVERQLVVDGPANGARSDRAWPSTQRTQYGPFLNFRGLQHAPINEQGVIFVFGMVAFDLGYVVEGVGTGYPDCEAKRCVSKAGDAWERVQVEFEYRSRNFREHGHDPAKCDLIVCWEDNWPDCPVEVLELRSSVESLGD